MALPITDTTEQPCAAGLERINGQCMPISVTTNTNAVESSSFSTVTMMMPTESAVTQTLPKMDACPPGTERAQNGQCESIQVSASTEALLESSSFSSPTTIAPEVTTVVVSDKAGKMEDCPQGTIRDQSGQCQPVTLSTSTEALLESSSVSAETMSTSETMLTTEAMLTTEGNTVAVSTEAGQSEACPPNTLRAKNGQCEPIEIMTTTPADEVETTSEVNEMSGKLVNLMKCPEGTKRDDDGACQEIVRANKTKTTDPKLFLEKDGSCPDGYKKVNGQCLFIGSKVNATSVPGEFNTLERIQPKSGVDESSHLNQLVRTNEDGSCPAGTQHYENGLCVVINQLLTPIVNSKAVCGDAYELVNGKCVRKGFHQLESVTESMTAATEQANTDDKLNEPKQSVEPTVETMTSGNELDENKPRKLREMQ